jgi:hypothetical protein
MRTESRPDLRVFYALLIGVGGLLAHLASEFAAMGSDADSIVFSPRHWYLGLGALAGIGIFISYGRELLRRSYGARDLKRILTLGVTALPLRGKGPAFYALTAGLQFAVGALTEIGEGCPFCGHDIIAGVLGALLTVALLALVLRALGRRLPSLVCTLAGYEPFRPAPGAMSSVRNELEGPSAAQGVWFPLLFNRPPPSLQSLIASL